MKVSRYGRHGDIVKRVFGEITLCDRGNDVSQCHDFIRMVDQGSLLKETLLEDAINYKLQLSDIKTLVYLTKQLKIKDEFDLQNTTDLYQKYKSKLILPIRQIASFEEFVYRDRFMHAVLKEKVDFYFMILQNLRPLEKSKYLQDGRNYRKPIDYFARHTAASSQ